MGNVLGRATGAGVESTNNLQLVMSILPVVGDLSSELSRKISKKDKRYGYLGNVQTSVGILAGHLKEIKEDGDAALYEEQINQLADCLEEIFSDEIFKLSKRKAFFHPRLHAVIEITSLSRGYELTLRHLTDFSVLNDVNAWDKLQINLKSITDELQSHGNNVDETDESSLPTTTQEPDEKVYDFVSRAFNTALCNRHVEPRRDVRLRIGTYKKGNLKSRFDSVCVLLAQDTPVLQWHEVHIHEKPQPKKKSNSSKAEHPPSQAGDSHQHVSEGTSCVCNYLKAHTRPDFLRLDLVLNHDILHPSGLLPDKRKFGPESLREQIHLKALLSVKDKPWAEPSKWALAVILAHSLLYLYNGSRTKGQWRRENIHFFSGGSRIPLQPFFGISSTPSKKEGSQDTVKFHRHPEILELGVTLLEIHLGQRLESFLKSSQDIETDNDFYWSACEAFGKEKVRIISRRYRKAIQACLTPATFDGTDSDVQKLRSVLFQTVVQPLNEELAENLPEFLSSDDLDEYAAKRCDLALSMPSPNHRSTKNGWSEQHQQNDAYISSHYKAVLELQPPSCANQTQKRFERDATDRTLFDKERYRGNDPDCSTSIVTWADNLRTGSSEKTMTVKLRQYELPNANMTDSKADVNASNRCSGEILDPMRMFSDARNPDRDKRGTGDWRVWLNDFTKFRQQILPDTIDPETQPRVRVTVIDTGIDGSHPYIKSKGWKSDDENAITDDQDSPVPLFCDFAQPNSARSEHDPIDEDGHGTFIAGILLQVAPDIELSVARIGVTRETIQNDAHIGKKFELAIRHAVKNWKTEIISMSFGKEEMSPEIRDAIKEAHDENVIVLAAAGNSGNRKGIPYPADEDRVFKIFAANSDGFAARFSPPSDQSPKYSYFIYGDGVVSTWPSSLQEQAKNSGLEVFCYDDSEAHKHSEDECDTRTVLSGTSFATPAAAALVAIIYQFYNANEPLGSRVSLRKGSEDKFKTLKAVRAIFTQMSRTSQQAPYNVLEPATGREDKFKFHPSEYLGPHRTSPVDQFNQSPIQFFSRKLSEILLQANV